MKAKIFFTFLTAVLITIGAISYFRYKTTYNIRQINSFIQAADVLNSADENTLVLFDVDDTLIVHASVLFRPKTFNNDPSDRWLKELTSTVFANTKKPVHYYLSILESQEVRLLIEKSIIQTIASLQKRGVKVLALTALWTGAYFTIPSVPEWRFNQLKELGIDFSKTRFPDMIFTELPADEDHFPMLYHGILCTIQASKGLVLTTFLDRVKWRPNQVIFFDDSMERVESVAREMQKRRIPFQGYLYKGVDFVPGELDKEVANFQLKYLVQHEKWLTEGAARALLRPSV